MNGFNERYYRDGELITNNGNALANLSNQMSTSLASLGLMNFERAKTDADRVGPARDSAQRLSHHRATGNPRDARRRG
jgi:hypothetical protein